MKITSWSYLPRGLQHRINDIVCTPKPVHTKTTYKGVLNLDTVHYHDVLIFKKGSMEVDSSIEALDLTLQRGATSSISEEASSFSYEHFLENHTYYHTAHRLLSSVSPISRAIHLKDQDILIYMIGHILIYTYTPNIVSWSFCFQSLRQVFHSRRLLVHGLYS